MAKRALRKCAGCRASLTRDRGSANLTVLYVVEFGGAPVELDPTRMCELLVGLPDVNVLAVADVAGEPLRVRVETREPRPACPSCGRDAAVKDRPSVELVDLAVFGRRARLIWRK